MTWFKWLFWESRFIISPFYLLIPPILIPEVYLEPYFKYSGLILRLIGFVLIIIGIHKKLKNFTDTGRGVERIFIEWWNKRPGQNKKVNLSGASESSANAHGYASVSRDFEGATVEEKLKFLLDFVEKLDDKITKLDKKVLKKEKEIKLKM